MLLNNQIKTLSVAILGHRNLTITTILDCLKFCGGAERARVGDPKTSTKTLLIALSERGGWVF